MKNKYFFTPKFTCCPISSLNPEKIKQLYTRELNKNLISRSLYFNLLSQSLGFEGWTTYLKKYESEIVPFLQKHGLIRYAPENDLNILKAKHDIKFTYREIADRLFFDERPYPKKIFTGYNCMTDNFMYHFPYGINPKDMRLSLEEKDTFEYRKKVIESNQYQQIKEKYNLDYLIPMDLMSFKGYYNLLSDLAVINEEEAEDKFLFCMYENNKGLVEQKEHIKIAKLLKDQLLSIKKGWIEVIPFNDNLIFLKAKDGTYDFVFKNLRDHKFNSPFENYIKNDYIPSIINEDLDFEWFSYFGFNKEPKNLKNFEPPMLWKEKDEHLSEVNFYENNSSKDYPGQLKILKDFYIKKGFYSYSKKRTSKILEGFNKVELSNRTLCISNLITIDEFYQFYNDEYKEKRSLSLDEIFTVNLEEGNLPISVTWYDAIAYCRYLENKYNVPFRLITPEEFEEICPSSNRSEFEKNHVRDIKAQLDFYLGNEKLSSPPPFMENFDDVIMKYKDELEFVSNNNLDFCITSSFREWSNYFKNGHATTLVGRYPEIEINRQNESFFSFQANLNYKYKYIKTGFRVCYEVEKEIK